MALWKLIAMREGGRRRTWREIETDPGVVGYFRLSYNGRDSHRVLAFYPRSTVDGTPEASAELYEPEILSFAESGLRVRGFENYNGAAVVQEWLCDVI